MSSLIFWKIEAKKVSNDLSPLWRELNAAFVTFLSYSWIIYISTAIIITICAYFAYSERCRRLEIRRRRVAVQRAQERPPQKRRPNAAYRDHQINRHIIISVAKYMKNPESIRPFFEHIDKIYPQQSMAEEILLLDLRTPSNSLNE